MRDRNQLKDLFNFEEELAKDKTPKQKINEPSVLDDLELLENEVSLNQTRQRYTSRAGIGYEA